MSSRTYNVPTGRCMSMEGIRVDVILENNTVLNLTLAPGVLVSDVLHQRGYTGEYIEQPAGLGRVNY